MTHFEIRIFKCNVFEKDSNSVISLVAFDLDIVFESLTGLLRLRDLKLSLSSFTTTTDQGKGQNQAINNVYLSEVATTNKFTVRNLTRNKCSNHRRDVPAIGANTFVPTFVKINLIRRDVLPRSPTQKYVRDFLIS